MLSADSTTPQAALQALYDTDGDEAPAVSLTERNGSRGPGARESLRMDFRSEDRVDDDDLNRVLWASIKGPTVPYPGTRRMAPIEWERSR